MPEREGRAESSPRIACGRLSPDLLERLRRRIEQEGRPIADAATSMRRVNPVYIPRNHLVEVALAAASDDGDLAPFDGLLDAVKQPYDERPGLEHFAAPAAASYTACYKTYCGT